MAGQNRLSHGLEHHLYPLRHMRSIHSDTHINIQSQTFFASQGRHGLPSLRKIPLAGHLQQDANLLQDGITIAWNVINIVYLVGRKRAFSNVTNVMVHFFLGTGFAIVGIYVTVVTWNAKKQLASDPYGTSDGKDHQMMPTTGQSITVNAGNVTSCPAFPNCVAQSQWEQHAALRALVSVIGCVLFDVAL
jgi:hypothetical protein